MYLKTYKKDGAYRHHPEFTGPLEEGTGGDRLHRQRQEKKRTLLHQEELDQQGAIHQANGALALKKLMRLDEINGERTPYSVQDQPQ